MREIRRDDERRGSDERDEGPFMDVVERLLSLEGDLVEAKFLPSPWSLSIIWTRGCELGRT